MKLNTRILMVIIFPFVLVITVSSISKALKPENSQSIKRIPEELKLESHQKSYQPTFTSFVDYKK